QRVDQRAAPEGGRRVDRQPGRLVDCQQVGVLKEDVDGDILCDDLLRTQVGLQYRHDLATLKSQRRLRYRFAVHLRITALNQLFGCCPAYVQLQRQLNVQPVPFRRLERLKLHTQLYP